MRILPNVVVSLAILLVCTSASAGDGSIRGTVTGSDGKPVVNANVSAQQIKNSGRTDSSQRFEARSDNKGRYFLPDIPDGTYAVMVAVKGVAKSVAKVRTAANKPLIVDFDLRPSAGGRNVAARPSPNPANTGMDDVRRMQQRLGGTINGMTFPGH